MKLLVDETDQAIAAAIAGRFPTLRLVSTPPDRRIVGTFAVHHAGQMLASYDVCVDMRVCDELGLPKVWETGGQIPRIPDLHINQTDGSACLYVPAEFALQHPAPCSVVEFLEGPVWNFFLGQAWVANGMGWPFGARAHGEAGIREFCAEVFGVSTDASITAYVELLARGMLKGHWPCPCGSGRKLRHCHQSQMARLKGCLSPGLCQLLLAEVRLRLGSKSIVGNE
jgi:SEC-C motif